MRFSLEGRDGFIETETYYECQDKMENGEIGYFSHLMDGSDAFIMVVKMPEGYTYKRVDPMRGTSITFTSFYTLDTKTEE